MKKAMKATGYGGLGVLKIISMPKSHIKENELLVKVITSSVYSVISSFQACVHNFINQDGLTFENRTSDFPKNVEIHFSAP